MSEIPKPTYEDAAKILQFNDNFMVIMDAIRAEREALIDDLETADTPDKVMKIAGQIIALNRAIKNLTTA